MKTKALRSFILLISACLLIVAFASCGAASKAESNGYYTDEAYDKINEGFDVELGNGSLPSLGSEYERKIIKTANISAETKEFDSAIAYIENLCTSVGGYVESSSIRGRSINSSYSYRYANYTIRVPAENLDSFASSLGNTLNIISSSSNANEVTSTYYDIKSRIEVLELQKASLQEMYDTYTDYKDIEYLLQLQDKLFDVIAEIESYQTQIKLYDDRVAYSTVILNISEVVDYTENKEDKTFFQRLGDAFVGGWGVFLSILSGMSVSIAYILPEFVIIAIIVAVILLVTRKKRRNKKKTQENKKD